MIALDTNVLVRFLTQDDKAQARAARSLVERCSAKAPALLCREVMVETVWILEGAYGLERARIAEVLLALLQADEFVVETANDVASALHAYRAGAADFADHLIMAAAERTGCETLYTFDRKAARHRSATLLVG